MLDKAGKVWLIEVNHLPSFGTDSPLDLDIKERLMEQVFQTIPVMPDDEDAYNQVRWVWFAMLIPFAIFYAYSPVIISFV